MSRDDGSDGPDLSAEWRRLRRAAIFFAFCLTVVVVLGVLGLYH